jgi:hypothetical protein
MLLGIEGIHDRDFKFVANIVDHCRYTKEREAIVSMAGTLHLD